MEAKEARTLAPDETAALKSWRRQVTSKPTKAQMTALLEVADRVEVLWQFALRRLQIAESEARRDIPVWGHDPEPSGGNVSRERIEESLADANGAYRRLRRVMDAWAALWFWPLTETEVQPPTFAQWLDALQQLLGRDTTQAKAHGKRSYAGMDQLGTNLDWDELNDAEKLDLGFADAKPVATVLEAHPWLRVCEDVADQQGFFHWELDFATVFARGGFDLQLGNPPWVRPVIDADALLAEGDPWWQLAFKPSEVERTARRGATLALPGLIHQFVDGITEAVCIAGFLSDSVNYPYLAGLQPDLYRCFMSQTWSHRSNIGTAGLLHPDAHFTEERAGSLRWGAYSRLRRHWQFINELKLFEIGNLVTYAVHVYGASTDSPLFIHATDLYHPQTVERSLMHDGSGPEPGLKNEDGNWDLRPHAARIITVDLRTLADWHAFLETQETPVRHTRMLYTVNRSTAGTLRAIAGGDRIAALKLSFSTGWHEKGDRAKGFFALEWGSPQSWDDAILQGPHLFVATPLYKWPNRSLRSHRDWSFVDLESLQPEAVPVTGYKPTGDSYRYDCGYTDWGTGAHPKPARDYYRVAWRNMVNNTGERTLIPALIPPGAAHVHAVMSAASLSSANDTVLASAFMSSLICDLGVRVSKPATLNRAVVERLPLLQKHPLIRELSLRILRLNCVVDAYSELWHESFNPEFVRDPWAGGRPRLSRPALGDIGPNWTATTPLRIAEDRRQALVEIDALVALMLGVSADELCTVYRTQFAVLHDKDRNTFVYDANGRLVPTEVLQVWRRKGDNLTREERTATNQAGNTYTYELPFRLLDREADMRQAYAHFERILAEREGSA